MIKFSREEKWALRHIYNKYNYIVRAKNGAIAFFSDMPERCIGMWLGGPYSDFCWLGYCEAFKCITWEDNPCEFHKYL